jgi:hypothetical protein
MRHLVPSLVGLMLIASAGATADIYRCRGSAGEVSYSQHPCAAATRIFTPTTGAASREPGRGVRASETEWLESRRESRAQSAAKSRPAAASRDDKRKAKQAYQCQQKARALDAVSAKLRRGYKPAQGEKLRRRRDGYADYLRTFCS